MAFIPVPNTAKVTLQWILSGQTIEITLSFTRGSGWDTPGLALLAQDVKDWFTGAIRSLLTSNIVLVNVNATDQSSASGPSYDLPVSSGGSGTAGGSPQSNNVTAAVKFITALRGRSFRGRNYWPSLSNSQVGSSIDVTSGFQAAVVAAYATLSSYLTISGGEHVVVSRFHNGAARGVGVTTPVTAYAMDSSIDSQRRRLSGRGI